MGISLNRIPSLNKRANFSSREFFFWVRLGLWLSLDAAVSFCADVVGESKRTFPRENEIPVDFSSPVGNFPSPWDFSDRPDPNQVGRLTEIPMKRISHAIRLALSSGLKGLGWQGAGPY